MRKFIFSILVLVLSIQLSEAGITIYYLRHAETGRNVSRAWRSKPREQWPDYVGNENTFTPKGWDQVAQIPKKLKDHSFDFIAVSPLWRTRQTIRPYLLETGRTAEIWPELEETVKCKMPLPDPLPKPASALFYGGQAIKLSADEQAFFTLREGFPNRCAVTKEESAQADAWAMAERTLECIRKQFNGRSGSILLVGHGNAGANLLYLLTGNRDISIDIRNTGVWMAEEQPDGTFRIRMLNDLPFAPGTGEKAN